MRVNPRRTSMPHVRRRCISRHSRGQRCISWQYRSEKRRVLHVESLVCTIPPSPADSTTHAPPPHTHRPRSTLTSTPPHQRCRAISMPGFSVSCPIPTSATGRKRNDDATISLKGAGFGTPPHSHECPDGRSLCPSAFTTRVS